MIDLNGGVFVFFSRLARKEKRSGDAVSIPDAGRGIERKYLLHHWVKSYAGTVVRGPGSGEIDVIGGASDRVCVRKNTRFKRVGRHSGFVRQRRYEAVALIIQEKERPVFLDRAAHGDAVQIPHVWVFRLDVTCQRINLMIEKVASAEGIPTAVVVPVTMERVGSTAGDHVNDRAVIAPIFGRKIARDHAEFLR